MPFEWLGVVEPVVTQATFFFHHLACFHESQNVTPHKSGLMHWIGIACFVSSLLLPKGYPVSSAFKERFLAYLVVKGIDKEYNDDTHHLDLSFLARDFTYCSGLCAGLESWLLKLKRS